MNILWSFRRCPYAMRARMALFLSEINYEHREIKLNNNNNHKQVIKYLKVKLLDSTQIEYNKKG